MIVTRVRTKTGSHIEPPLDQGWDDLTKLRWCAAVVMGDCPGLKVEIEQEASLYRLRANGSGFSAGNPRWVWTLLNGIETGWREAIKFAGAE